MKQQAEDHNGSQWLVVRYGDMPRMGTGWFVVRICPCHRNAAVTAPLESQERAERARTAMLAMAAREFGDAPVR